MSSTTLNIQAELRSDLSGRASRQYRKAGNVLGVIYGRHGLTSITFPLKSMPAKHTGSQSLTIEVGGAKKTVVMREVQMDVIKTLPIHVDFQEVTPAEVINIQVPVNYVGLTKEQEKEGSFKVLRRSLEVRGPVGKLPEMVTIDVGHLKTGEHIQTTAVNLPDGVKLRAQKPFAIASLTKL